MLVLLLRFPRVVRVVALHVLQAHTPLEELVHAPVVEQVYMPTALVMVVLHVVWGHITPVVMCVYHVPLAQSATPREQQNVFHVRVDMVRIALELRVSTALRAPIPPTLVPVLHVLLKPTPMMQHAVV